MKFRLFPITWLLIGPIASMSGCKPTLATPLYDPAGGFFDRPFPSDERQTQKGFPDWTDFPNPSDQGLLSAYIDTAGSIEGVSTLGGIFFRFESSLDTTYLPSAQESLSTDSPVLLIDVDPGSPERGRLFPLSLHWQDVETAYQASHLLSLAPHPGAPLRPRTQYAALITTGLAEPHPEQAAVWKSSDPRHDTWQPVQETLLELDISVNKLAIGTVFTTQDPVLELAEYAWWIKNNQPIPSWDQTLVSGFSTSHFQSGEGVLQLPLFQHGEKPYSTAGGGFQRDDDGDPLIASWETMSFTLSVPTNTAPPATGWPVVVWAHGTGGDHTNCCDNSAPYETARMLADASIAVMSVPQPLHGDRATPGTIPELHSFNPMNAEAARTNFRQGALDIVSLSSGLAARSHTFELDGTSHFLDPNRVFVAGHSHGGITAAIAGAFIGDTVPALFLSAAGGGMSNVLTQRTEPIDLENLIHEALELEDHERLQPLHPVSTLIQTVTDVTDPINYARYWKDDSSWFSTQPVSVLMSEGLLDEPTPPAAMEALAAAGGLPQLTRVHQSSTAHKLLSIQDESPPTTANLTGYDNQLVTGGLAQFPDQGHFVVFSHPPAATLFQQFFQTAAYGSATIVGFDGE